MYTLEDYLEIKGVSRQTCYNWLRAGKIMSVKQGKEVRIIDPDEQVTADHLAELLTSKKKSWNAMVLKAHTQPELKRQVIDEILAEAEWFKLRGVKVIGFDEKSLYRKIKAGKTRRKKRDEKKEYRNDNLLKSIDKILAVASYFYLQNAKQNFHLTTDLVLDYAAKNENYYEVAAIPRSTLYRAIRKEIRARGVDELHQYLNHFNVWNADLPHVHGAWTEDVQFMDWIVGDDHKCDVHRVLEFDELKNALAEKTVYTWFWIEGRTQKVLSYIIQTREITTDDLKRSLMVALRYNGLPKKGIMVDNGVAKSSDFKRFCYQMGMEVEYSKPYEPTEKSTAERIFGYIKNESDVFRNNFTGSNHRVEGRHTWKSLTPDKPDYTYDEFKSALEGYIDGFYETRERTRTIDNKKVRISIRDYFNDCCMQYEPIPVDDKKLRRAYQMEHVKKFRNGITFKGFTYLCTEYLSPVFNNRKYTVCFNPNDYSTIDIYALETIVDKTTGTYAEPGDYVATLTNPIAIPMTDRPGVVNKIKQGQKKALKLLAEHYTDKVISDNPELRNAVNSTVGNNGKVKSVRKQIEKEVRTALEVAVPEREVRFMIEKSAARESMSIEDIISEDAKNLERDAAPVAPEECDLSGLDNLLDENEGA